MQLKNSFNVYRYCIKVHIINKPVYLIPFGDIHRFAKLCHVGRWKEFIEWAKKKDNCYFIGMGDYDDMLSFSERKAYNESSLHDNTRSTIDDIMLKHTEDFCDEIKFMKGKLIGMLEGNHYGILKSDITTTQKMCDILGTRYLGASCFIRLSFEYQCKHACIDIWAHHGKGAARLVGTSMNSVQNMESIADADIYMCGHDHKKSIAMKSRLKLNPCGNGIELSHKKILFCRTGSFLLGYVPNEQSYVAEGCLNPTELGVVKIELTPKREQKTYNSRKSDIFYVDIHASI